MSRRAASFTQADVHRALKAAQQAGPDWRVEVEGGVIRLFRGETATPICAKVQELPEVPTIPEKKWKF